MLNPYRITVCDGGLSTQKKQMTHYPVTRKSELFANINEKCKKFFEDMMVVAPDSEIPLEKWGELVSERSMLVEYKTAVRQDIVKWLLDRNNVSPGAPSEINKLLIIPEEKAGKQAVCLYALTDSVIVKVISPSANYYDMLKWINEGELMSTRRLNGGGRGAGADESKTGFGGGETDTGTSVGLSADANAVGLKTDANTNAGLNADVNVVGLGTDVDAGGSGAGVGLNADANTNAGIKTDADTSVGSSADANAVGAEEDNNTGVGSSADANTVGSSAGANGDGLSAEGGGPNAGDGFDGAGDYIRYKTIREFGGKSYKNFAPDVFCIVEGTGTAVFKQINFTAPAAVRDKEELERLILSSDIYSYSRSKDFNETLIFTNNTNKYYLYTDGFMEYNYLQPTQPAEKGSLSASLGNAVSFILNIENSLLGSADLILSGIDENDSDLTYTFTFDYILEDYPVYFHYSQTKGNAAVAHKNAITVRANANRAISCRWMLVDIFFMNRDPKYMQTYFDQIGVSQSLAKMAVSDISIVYRIDLNSGTKNYKYPYWAVTSPDGEVEIVAMTTG